MKVVSTRILLLLTALLAVVGLTGCQTKSGAAAVVDGQRISESSIAKNLVGSGDGTTNARTFVLTYVIKERLFAAYLASTGKVPTDAELAAVHDDAVNQVLSSSLGTGAAADKLIDTVLAKEGIAVGFRSTVVRSAELEELVIKAVYKTSAAQFYGDVNKAGIKVSVSPRYGSWDQSTLTLQDAATPSFLTGVPTTAAAGS